MKTKTIYEFTVTMRHETQGFAKTFHPAGATLQEALTDADEQLATSGYDPAAFECIEAKRGTVVELNAPVVETPADSARIAETLIAGLLYSENDAKIEPLPPGNAFCVRFGDRSQPIYTVAVTKGGALSYEGGGS